jgi:hypothetical protein
VDSLHFVIQSDIFVESFELIVIFENSVTKT